MEQRDNILRQIEQLARVLGKLSADLIGLKGSPEIGTRTEAAEKVLQDNLHMSISEILDLNPVELQRLLLSGNMYSENIPEELARIMSLLASTSEKSEKQKLLKWSLRLYEFLENSGNTYSMERNSLILEIRAALANSG